MAVYRDLFSNAIGHSHFWVIDEADPATQATASDLSLLCSQHISLLFTIRSDTIMAFVSGFLYMAECIQPICNLNFLELQCGYI